MMDVREWPRDGKGVVRQVGKIGPKKAGNSLILQPGDGLVMANRTLPG
ncbi:MAG: hypothetical protein H8D34_27200 [Chloroflexi bacterium]|nr:hypothetical protein [Chloroflexota bacterium]